MSRINFFLRTAILFYLYYHFLKSWQGTINFALSLLLFFITISSAYMIGKRFYKQNKEIRLLLLFSLPLALEIIRILLWSRDLILAKYFSTLLVEWDLTYQPLRLILYFLFYSTIAFLLVRPYQIIEMVFRPFLVLIIFWHMRNFALGFYPNLLYLLLSLVFYNVLEIALLARLLNPHLSRKGMFWVALKVIFFTLISSMIALPWVYKKASPHMKSQETLLRSQFNSFDVSENLSLEPEVNMGSKLLFLVQSDGALEDNLLLRRITLSHYDEEKGFTFIRNLDEDLSATFAPHQIWPLPAEIESTTLNAMTFYLLNLPKSAIITPYNIHDYRKLAYEQTTKFSHVFQIEYYNPRWLMDGIAEKKAHKPASKENELDYIYAQTVGITTEIEDLAHRITAGIGSDYEKALSIQNYFHNNFYYSLTPGKAHNSNQLQHFLFESQRGYCSYFATAMTLMVRSLGMTARTAGGFRLSRDNQLLDFYAVTSAQAHAWVEIYFEDIGWIVFDPTPSRLDPHEFILEEEHSISEDIYAYIQEIHTLKEKFPQGETLEHNQITYSKEKKIPLYFFILIFFSLIFSFLIMNILLRIFIIKKSLTLDNSKLYTALQFWITFLQYPRKSDWQDLLMKNDTASKSIDIFLFDNSSNVTDVECSIIREHLKQCYTHYKGYSLIEQFSHLLAFPLWRFRDVF